MPSTLVLVPKLVQKLWLQQQTPELALVFVKIKEIVFLINKTFLLFICNARIRLANVFMLMGARLQTSQFILTEMFQITIAYAVLRKVIVHANPNLRGIPTFADATMRLEFLLLFF